MTSMLSFPRIPALTLLLLASVARAQSTPTVRSSLDLGVSTVRYADSINVSALSLAPAFHLARGRASLGGSGTISKTSGSSSYSGSVFGALSSSVERRLSAELGGTLGGSAHSDGARTGQTLGTGRVYMNAARGGMWGGGGLGRTWDGVLWRNLVQGSVGAWQSFAAGSGVVSLTPTAVDDTIRYMDAVATAQHEVGALELTGNIGTRIGDPVPSLVTDRVWGSVSALTWVRPTIALVASAGTYPVDFSQGFPGGRFLSFAVRVAAGRATAPRASDATVPNATVREFELVRAEGDARRIRVFAPAAQSVEIAGDFTGWESVLLTPSGRGWWTITRTIPPGTHEVSVRVNGGAWLVPPGLAPLRDEFGGASGVFTIP